MGMYHINDKGNAGVCEASSGNCPFGGDDEHFTSKAAAQKSFELQMTPTFEAVQQEKLAQAKARLLAAKQALRKADDLMAATANWEHASTLTKEGERRAAAVAKFNRAKEREERAREAVTKIQEKLAPKKDKVAELREAVDETRKALRDFYAENKYPSPRDKNLNILLDNYKNAHEAQVREQYEIPEDWRPRRNYTGGVSFIPKASKSGPNGSLLEASPKRPYGDKVKDSPEEALYIQTSAGYYVSGPYDSPAALEEGMRNYSGPSSPGPIGWD